MLTLLDILKILNRIPNIEIISVKSTYGSELLKIWDIGMRPLFRPLVKMANNLDELQRIEIKKEWCSIFIDLFSLSQ